MHLTVSRELLEPVALADPKRVQGFTIYFAPSNKCNFRNFRQRTLCAGGSSWLTQPEVTLYCANSPGDEAGHNEE